MQYSGQNTPLGHHTDRGPMGLGQYNSLGEYCDPHTASSVFLILVDLQQEGPVQETIGKTFPHSWMKRIIKTDILMALHPSSRQSDMAIS